MERPTEARAFRPATRGVSPHNGAWARASTPHGKDTCPSHRPHVQTRGPHRGRSLSPSSANLPPGQSRSSEAPQAVGGGPAFSGLSSHLLGETRRRPHHLPHSGSAQLEAPRAPPSSSRVPVGSPSLPCQQGALPSNVSQPPGLPPPGTCESLPASPQPPSRAWPPTCHSVIRALVGDTGPPGSRKPDLRACDRGVPYYSDRAQDCQSGGLQQPSRV